VGIEMTVGHRRLLIGREGPGAYQAGA